MPKKFKPLWFPTGHKMGGPVAAAAPGRGFEHRLEDRGVFREVLTHDPPESGVWSKSGNSGLGEQHSKR